MIKIIKKDGTEEDYNVKKVVVAVKKSANRALVEFTDEDIHKICAFVDSRVLNMQKDKIHIAEMHNIVEGARYGQSCGSQKLQRLQKLQTGFCSHAGRSLSKRVRQLCT